jgi:DNA primase
MAGRIPQAFIDDLITRVDIVDLVGQRVPLKKAGKDYQARCPFHDEKTPSFTVSRDKQFYHCFGCGAHGTALGFLMEYERLGFVEAVEALAQQVGLEIPRDNAPPGPDTGPLYQLLARATDYYRTQLKRHPKAIEYLKGRGLSGQTAAAFGLGYAPPGWDNLLRDLGADPDVLERLDETGMLAESQGRRYDRFRDRIMFPIRDQRGRTIGFGGRILGNGKPKYLNSPETPLFHKGRELYGLFEARRALRRMERAIVVEGYMDVIALAQFGVPGALATLGTAVTPEHLERLYRATPEVVFCLDGDRAGRDAAWKALNNVLPLLREGRSAKFLFLPQGEDPDSLIRAEGQQGFAQRVQRATPLSDFLFAKLTRELDTSSLDDRARLAERAKPLLNRLPSGVFREMMYQRLGELVRLLPAKLGGHPRGSPNGPLARPLGRPGPRRISLQLRALALLLQHPYLAGHCPDLDPAWQQCHDPEADLFGKILELLRIDPNLTKAELMERWRGHEAGRHLDKAAALNLELPAGAEGQELAGAVRRLTEQYREQELERLLEKSVSAPFTAAEKQRLMQLLRDRSATSSDQGPRV